MNDKKIDKNADNIEHMKKNYTERFDDIKSELIGQHEETMKVVNKLEILLTQVMTKVEEQAKFCNYVQQRKMKDK